MKGSSVPKQPVWVESHPKHSLWGFDFVLPITIGRSAPRKPPTIFTPVFLAEIQVVDCEGLIILGLKYAVFISNPQNGRFIMKYLITGLIISMLSATALAGALIEPPPVAEVPEPGMLGLFAASVAALFVFRKFRK